jgi:Histidine phosphatase superfamily (branch 1)
MFKLPRRTVAGVVVSFGLFTTLGTAVAGPATEANKDIAQMLRAGGFIIVVRRGGTFPDRADTDPLNFGNVAAQRNLNDKGKVLAKAFGDAVRRVGIPVGKVYTSKYSRAYETADIAGFKDIEKTADLTEGGLVANQLLTGELSMSARITLAGLELLVLSIAAVASSTQPSRADSCSHDIDRAWVQGRWQNPGKECCRAVSPPKHDRPSPPSADAEFDCSGRGNAR